LAVVPRLVQSELQPNLAGLGIGPDDRAELEERQAAYRRRYMMNPYNDPRFLTECLVAGLIIFCPVIAVGIGVLILPPVNTVAYIGGVMKDKTDIPAKGDGDRLMTLFRQTQPAKSLYDQVSQRLQTASPAPAYPQLVVSVDSARLVSPMEGGTLLEVTARSRVFSDAGTRTPEATHVVLSHKRTVSDWLAADGRLFQDDVRDAVAALAEHIASSYGPR
jgi:hypothetical protein